MSKSNKESMSSTLTSTKFKGRNKRATDASVRGKQSRSNASELRIQIPSSPTSTAGPRSTTSIQLTSTMMPPPLPHLSFPPGPQPPYQHQHQHQHQHQQLYPYYDGSWGQSGDSNMNVQTGTRSTTPSGYIGCIVHPFESNTGNNGFNPGTTTNGTMNDHHGHHSHLMAAGTSYQYSSYNHLPSSVRSNQYNPAWNNSVRFSPPAAVYQYPGSDNDMPNMMGGSAVNASSTSNSIESSRGNTATMNRSKARNNFKQKTTTKSIPRPIDSNGNPQTYISQIILDGAASLELPPNGVKFTNGHWSSALRLFYRWKTTMDEIELSIQSSASTMASSSSSSMLSARKGPGDNDGDEPTKTKASDDENNNTNTGENLDPSSINATKKSVKAFVDKVLQRESKRRQFSIHWNDCGLKEFFEKQMREDRKPITESYNTVEEAAAAYGIDTVMYPSQPFVPFDHPEVSAFLDDYFSGRKRSRDYVEAEELAKQERQQKIDNLWMTVTGLPRKKLKELQSAIEAPYKSKIVVNKKGKKTTHEVVLDGFGGAKYSPPGMDVAIRGSKKAAKIIRGSNSDHVQDGTTENEVTSFGQRSSSTSTSTSLSTMTAAKTLAFVVGDRCRREASGSFPYSRNHNQMSVQHIGTMKAIPSSASYSSSSSSSSPTSLQPIVGDPSSSMASKKTNNIHCKKTNVSGVGGSDNDVDQLNLLPKISSDDKEN